MGVPVYLFAVQCTSTTSDRWDVKPLLFCVDAHGRRRTFWLQDYEAHVLLFPNSADLQVADVEQHVESDSRLSITRVDTCVKTPVVGFTNGRKDTLIRVHYRDLGARYRLRRCLEDLDAVVLHRSYSAEMLLLHITGLKLQQWYTWDGRGDVIKPPIVDQGPALRIPILSLRALADPPAAVAPLSYACVRLSLCSSTAMPSNLFLPDHAIEHDVIESCELRLGRMDSDQMHSFSLAAETERELLLKVCAWFREHSPCIVVHMSDPLDHVAYLHFRAARYRITSGLSALLRAPCVEHQFPETKRFRDIGLPGRESVDVLHLLQKFMTSPPLDGFSIADAFAHPKLLRDKAALSYTGDEGDVTLATAAVRKEHMRKELDVIAALQRDNAFLLNNLALSASCGLPLFNIVSRGQQKRAFAVFAQAYHDADLYINHAQFERPYVVVPRPRAQSSFPDPPWIANAPLADLRARGGDAPSAPPKKKRRSVLSLLGRAGTAVPTKGAKPATQKRYGGGFVMHPEPGFYAEPWQAVCTMDFASLYPSIMEGYRTCYMRVCYDPAYLDDPRAEKQYIPLDEQHCCVLISRYDGKDVRSITDRIVGDVVQNRKRVRARMKTTTDKFSLQSLNGTQLSMKVLQNAFYGACGSETFGVPCTAIAASVCTIGQWMNKTIRHRALARGCRCVYGDTDSIFVQFPTDPALVDRDDILADIYRQAHELEQETTRIFPPPNAVEFETLKLPHLQTSKKKLYAAREYPPGPRGWTATPTELFKGYCFKKRDRCPFVQRLCREFIQKLLDDRADENELLAWYEHAVRTAFDVRPGADALADFVITCRLNDTYKNEEALALALASTYERETGTRQRPGSRLKFVVGDFGDERKHAESVLTPATFLRKGHRLSAAYYLEKQLLLPLVQILDLRPALLARVRRATERMCVRITSRSTSLETMLQRAV